MSCCIVLQFAVAYVNLLKIVFLVCVVAIDSTGVSLLANIREYAGRASVSTGTGVERISWWACL